MLAITFRRSATLRCLGFVSLTCLPWLVSCASKDNASAAGDQAAPIATTKPKTAQPDPQITAIEHGPSESEADFAAAAPPAVNVPGPASGPQGSPVSVGAQGKPASPVSPVSVGTQGNPRNASQQDAGLASSEFGPPAAVNPIATDVATQTPATDAIAPRYYPTNPFVKAEHDPQSTFAADVDTASYDLFRQYVRQGSQPAAASVRLEEFVNYFSYEYPDPVAEAGKPFSISLDAAPDILDPASYVLRVGIQARAYTQADKRPSNLVFLVDISGSMQEELPMVQALLRETLNLLSAEDRVSIVTYAGATRVALASTKVSEKNSILAAIDSFSAGGSTAGSAGLALAYQQADAGFLQGGLNHIILCTDGDFNVGVSSDGELLKQITDHRKSGVTFTGLGFGTSGVNDAMLEAVSDAGNGVYSVISSVDDGVKYGKTRMLQNLTYVAKDVKLQVEFNPEHVLAYRLLGYEDRDIADQDFRNDVVDAGEIGTGHRVTALYQVVLADGSLPNASDAPPVESGAAFDGDLEVSDPALVRVKVRYKDIDAKESDSAHEVYEELQPNAILASFDALSADARWASAVGAFAEILKGSPYRKAQDLGVIRSVLSDAAGIDPVRAEFLSLVNASSKTLMGQ